MTELDPTLDLAKATDARQRVLLAAIEVFAKKGFDGASVREICTLAEANIAAVNYYFRDKERLYIEAVKFAHQSSCGGNWNEIFQVPDNVPPVEQLKEFIRQLARRMYAPADPKAMQLMMREMAHPTSAGREVVQEFIQPVAFRLRSILTMLKPDLPPPRVLMFGFSIMGQILFYRQNRPVSELIFGTGVYEHLNADLVADHIVRFTLGGLGLGGHS